MSYSEGWQKKFDFYDKAGLPKSSTYQAAFKALPFFERVVLNFNVGAFFFGFIYFFYIGRPKQALAIILWMVLLNVGAQLLINVVGHLIDPSIHRLIFLFIGLSFTLINMQAANISYYLKEKKNAPDSFNPYKELRWF